MVALLRTNAARTVPQKLLQMLVNHLIVSVKPTPVEEHEAGLVRWGDAKAKCGRSNGYASGLRGERREYCRGLGIPVTTFDYYRQREGRRIAAKRKARPAVARVVEVKLKAEAAQSLAAFALVLRNGRRIEGAWGFADGDLARLIRVAEGA